MPIVTMKVLASLLQLHGPGATVQSDHQGINALLADIHGRISQETPAATEVVFRKGGFVRGGAAAGAFRRGAFRRY